MENAMISVLIINYNTAKMVKRAVESVLMQQGVKFKLLVLDNQSTDDSVAVLKSFKDRIELVVSEKNLGFGKGVNQLFNRVDTPYIYLLNPDAWLIDHDTLARLVAYMTQHPEYGMVTTNMIDEAGKHRVNPQAGRYIGESTLKHPLPKLPGDIAWAFGATIAMQSHVFREIGGFDEDYFVYSEDMDISLRVRKAGYPIGYLSEVVIGHLFGSSESDHVYDRQFKKQISRNCFCYKHYHPSDANFIIQKSLNRAKRRIWRYRFLLMLFRNSVHYRRRYQQFRAILDVGNQKEWWACESIGVSTLR